MDEMTETQVQDWLLSLANLRDAAREGTIPRVADAEWVCQRGDEIVSSMNIELRRLRQRVKELEKEAAENQWRQEMCGTCGQPHAEFPKDGTWADYPYSCRKGKWFCNSDPDGTHPSGPDDAACPAWKKGEKYE